MPKRIPHTITEEGSRSTETHEAFGLVKIDRIQGRQPLFGSHLENHGTYFNLTVCQAQVDHELGRDWYYPRAQLIEISMSAAQFAELITTLNCGSGVPCTVDRVDGVRMERVPTSNRTESHKIRSSFEKSISSLVKFVKKSATEVEAILEKKSLTKTDKAAVLGALHKTLMELESNAPFMVESFQEAAEKVVTAAKTEVDAFMSLSLHRMGLDAAQKRIAEGETPLKALVSGEPQADD